MSESRASAGETVRSDHRRLDELFGRFLAALHASDAAAARDTIAAFDAALRHHTAFEEERLYPQAAAGRLDAPARETERKRLFRELRLEHVQVRELSGMLVRIVTEKGLDAARGLTSNLARRWDAHTAREEREALP